MSWLWPLVKFVSIILGLGWLAGFAIGKMIHPKTPE